MAKTYSFEEVHKATLDYFNGNEMLTNIWLSKYALKDENKNYVELTPDERLQKISSEIARAENKYNSAPDFVETVYSLIKDFKYFIPGGSILYGAGNPYNLSSLGNCFVIGNNVDSYGSICLIDQEQTQLMKRRGGVGHDLSHLRPNKSIVNGCAATSTGAFSFAHRYSNSTREVAQDGRRGALMLSAHINHPDIEDFITLKDDLTSCTGANISVKLTDEFMHEVENNENHNFRFPIDSNNIVCERPAKDIYNKIIHQAWKNAEPGVLFWDTILRESPADCYASLGFKTVSTNPCGEIPLSPYDSCRLGHCNLAAYVKNPYTSDAEFDYVKFREDARVMQRIMDDIIDLEIEKIDKIISTISNSNEDPEITRTELNLWNKVRTVAINGRRTGLGILGEADAVASLGMRYSSKEANDFLINVHKEFASAAYKESILMAKERGAFPCWDYELEKNNPFINRILNLIDNSAVYSDYKIYGRRNIACLTLAPTGTVSQFAFKEGVTSGMEPVFEISYLRRRKVNNNDAVSNVNFVDNVGDKFETYRVYHPGFLRYLKANNIEANIENISDEQLKELVKNSPYYLSTANEVDVISKIHLQGEIQKYVDHSISVTHNLPKETTEEQIYQYYMEAWKSGCKGITVYRDGSRSGVLIRDEQSTNNDTFKYTDAKKRPKVLECEIHKLTALKENWTVIIGLYNGNPYEVFAIKDDKLPISIKATNFPLKGKITKRKKRTYDLEVTLEAGNIVTIPDISSYMELDDRFDTRHFSLDLRHGIDPRWIVELFEKQDKPITSFEKAVSRVLKRYISDGEKSGLVCSNCGSTNVIYVSGCPYCKDCGTSKCG